MDTEKKARLLSQAEGNQGAAARMKKEGPGYRQLTLEFPPTEDEKEQEAIVEAVLFTMGQSVESRQLAAAIGQSEDCARKAALRLKERYDREKKGIQIIELENAFQMCTRAEYYENLIRVAATPKRQVLTEVVLETLSIIAYRQPVTKMEIEKIRGVKSDHAVNKLIEYNLVCEVGRLDAPGRPALFATTEEFLRRFGIGSTNDLPGLNPEQEEEIKTQVEEELQLKLEELGEEAGTENEISAEVIQQADRADSKEEVNAPEASNGADETNSEEEPSGADETNSEEESNSANETNSTDETNSPAEAGESGKTETFTDWNKTENTDENREEQKQE